MGARSLESMHTIVCAATEALDLRELASLALPHLARAFGASHAVCYEISNGGMQGHMVPGPEPWIRYADYAHEDPLQAVKLRHNPQVAVTTDIIDTSALRRTAVYADVFRPFDAERHMVLRISDIGYGTSGVSAIVLTRARRQPEWSTEDEGDLLRLRPALAAFSRRHARSREPRSGPVAQLAFDLTGRVLWVSRDAVGILGRANACRLPEHVLAAVRSLGALAATAAVPCSLDVELEALVDGQRLRGSLQLAVAPATGERIILARFAPGSERAPLASAVDVAAARHGLSPAEAAVLREMAAGASNAGIGERLRISPHTVRTHLMHIFPKLGVHSRTAALVKVSEALAAGKADRAG